LAVLGSRRRRASVPRWLAEQVGPSGTVVASDIDTGRLATGASNIEVLRHDVALDDPPAGGFDLVHARLVLTHVPERQRALRNLVEAVAPGGSLVIEDFDPALVVESCLNPATDAERRANKLRHGFVRLLAARGVDLEYGRKLPGLLRAEGLIDVGADAFSPSASPPRACSSTPTLRRSPLSPSPPDWPRSRTSPPTSPIPPPTRSTSPRRRSFRHGAANIFDARSVALRAQSLRVVAGTCVRTCRRHVTRVADDCRRAHSVELLVENEAMNPASDMRYLRDCRVASALSSIRPTASLRLIRRATATIVSTYSSVYRDRQQSLSANSD
jgi:Methyltransferase domain